MKKSVITSLSAAAIVWGLSVPALAQTCLKTPTCADLGYTKSAADCTGKTILKCPLDNTKVYCPSDTETARTYKVGDYYYYNGNAVGKIIEITGNNLTVASIPMSATSASIEGLASYCSSLNAAAGAWSPLSTVEECKKARSVWKVMQDSWNGTIITSGYSHFCQGDCSCFSTGSSSYSYYYVCLSIFKA